MGRHSSESPVKARGSPRRRSLSRRERSPARHRSSNTDKLSTHNRSPKRARSRSPVFHSPVRDKPYHRTKSPDHRKSPPARSRSPVRQKPSNRTRSPEKGKPQIRNRSPRRERSRSLDSPSPSPRSKRLKRVTAERDSQKGNDREHERRDLTNEKKDRRSERDAVGNGSRSRHGRSDSPPDRHHRGRRRSRSPVAADSRGHNEWTNSRDPEQRDDDSDSIAKMKAVEETLDAKDKQKPSFELSGKLAAETNRVRGVTLLFNEPADARKPDIRWRLYVFKGGEVLNEPLYVHRQSCYLFGRERRVADIPTDHPSCSKQHAVLQYRQVEEENPDGTMSKRVRPYLMDLGSTNGTFINDNQMEPQRYYELFEKDTIKFGNSSREYVLLHENSSG